MECIRFLIQVSTSRRGAWHRSVLAGAALGRALEHVIRGLAEACVRAQHRQYRSLPGAPSSANTTAGPDRRGPDRSVQPNKDTAAPACLLQPAWHIPWAVASPRSCIGCFESLKEHAGPAMLHPNPVAHVCLHRHPWQQRCACVAGPEEPHCRPSQRGLWGQAASGSCRCSTDSGQAHGTASVAAGAFSGVKDYLSLWHTLVHECMLAGPYWCMALALVLHARLWR